MPLERRERTPSEARASRFRSAPPTPDTPLKTPSVVFVPISGASHGAGRSFGPNHPSDAGAEDDADAPDAARSSGRAREAASARRTFERSDLTSSSSSQSKAGGPEPEDVDAARDAHTRCSARHARRGGHIRSAPCDVRGAPRGRRHQTSHGDPRSRPPVCRRRGQSKAARRRAEGFHRNRGIAICPGGHERWSEPRAPRRGRLARARHFRARRDGPARPSPPRRRFSRVPVAAAVPRCSRCAPRASRARRRTRDRARRRDR